VVIVPLKVVVPLIRRLLVVSTLPVIVEGSLLVIQFALTSLRHIRTSLLIRRLIGPLVTLLRRVGGLLLLLLLLLLFLNNGPLLLQVGFFAHVCVFVDKLV